MASGSRPHAAALGPGCLDSRRRECHRGAQQLKIEVDLKYGPASRLHNEWVCLIIYDKGRRTGSLQHSIYNPRSKLKFDAGFARTAV